MPPLRDECASSGPSKTRAESRSCPRGWTRSRLGVLVLTGHGAADLVPRRKGDAVRSAGKRGPVRCGWRAFRGLTLFATEWSAARRKPIRAAALHFSAAISADVKARRLPTSDRRKFPSGNFRSARDLEGAERVSPRKARLRPNPSPFARKRGMSPIRGRAPYSGNGLTEPDPYPRIFNPAVSATPAQRHSASHPPYAHRYR